MANVDRRGEAVALLGMFLSLVGAVVLAILAMATGSTSSATWASAFLVFGSSGVWLLTLIQLHQRRLVAEETLEVAELERQRREKLGGAKTIFDEEELDQMERLATGRRLRSIERFLVPTLALMLAAYHLVAGVLVLPWAGQFPPLAQAGVGAIEQPMVQAIVCGAIAFICFMLSRYALGMSQLREYGALCAGGNFAFGSSAACFAAAVGLLCAGSDLRSVELWVGRAIGILMIVLAVETAINFVLDFYRPRVAGQRQRPFYDSRLLGMFSEPEGILHSLANAIDYQFGFKVSETWFYKLLGRAVVPLLLVQAAVILLLTCIVVVPPGHQAVIERWGFPRATTAKPGLHFTLPWPADRATIIPVERIQRMELGYDPKLEEEHRRQLEERGEKQSKQPILWTKAHYKKEYKLLVADRLASADTAVPINLLSMTMPVQWRVKPADAEVIRFHAQSRDAGGIIESVAYRELTRYAAQVDILDLLGAKGIDAAETLHQRIQEACDTSGYDGKGLGVEIVYVGVGGIHPPPEEDVSKAYEDVVSAYEKKESLIRQAEGDAAQMTVSIAGDEWREVFKAIEEEDKARLPGTPPQVQAERTSTAERMLREHTGGMARDVVAQAMRQTLERVFAEKSASERYATQLLAYRAAPYTYMLRLYLRMLEVGLQDVQKYVVVMDDPSKVIYEVDPKAPAAFDALAAELGAAEAKPR